MKSSRRRLRTLGIGLVGLTGVVLFGLGVGVVWLRTDAGNAFLQRRLEQAIDLSMHEGSATIGRLRTDLFTGWALEDVALLDASGHPLVVLDEATLGLRPIALLGGTLEVTELRATGLRADLSIDESGTLDLAALFGPPAAEDTPASPWEGLPVDLEVSRLLLDDARIDVRGPDGPVLSAAGARAEAALTVEGRLARLDNLDARVDLAQPQIGHVTLGGSATWDGEEASLDGLTLGLGEGEVALSGRVSDLQAIPNLDLSLEARPIDLKPLDALAASGLQGRWEGALTLRGPLEQVTVAGSLAGVAPDTGALAIDLAIDLTDEDLPWTATATATGLHVEDAVATVGDDPLVITGVLTASGSGNRWPTGVTAGGEFVGDEVLAYGVELDAGRARLDLAEGQLRWTEVHTEGPLGPLSASGRYDFVDWTVQTSLTGPLALAELARFGATDLDGTGNLDLTIDVDTSGEHTRTTVRGRVVARPLLYGEDVRFEQVDATIRSVTSAGRTDVTGRFLATDGVAYGTTLSAFEEPRLVVQVDEEGTSARGEGAFDGFAISSVARIHAGDAAWDVRLPTGGSLGADVTLFPGSFDFFRNQGRDGELAIRLANDIAHVEGRIGGTSERPVLDLDLDYDLGRSALVAERLRCEPVAGQSLSGVGPIRLVLPSEGTGVHDAMIRLDGGLGQLTLMGDLATAGQVGAELETVGLDLAFVSALLELDEPLQGSLGGRMSIRGDAADPTLTLSALDLRGFDGDIDVTGRVEGFAHRLDLSLEAKVGDAPLAAVIGELPVHLDLADMHLKPEENVDLSLALRPGELARLERWTGPITPGVASGAVRLTGVLGDADVEGTGIAELDVQGWSQPARIEASVERHGEELLYWLDLFEGFDRRGELAGTAATGVEEVFAWALRGGAEPDWSDLDLFATALDAELALRAVPAASLAALSGLTEDVAGTIEGRLTATGGASTPIIEAEGQWIGGHIGMADVDRGFIEITEEDGTYTPTLGLTFLEGGGLYLSGELPLTVDLEAEDWSTWQTAPLAGSVGGPGIPLGLLAAFDPGIQRTRGMLNLEGTVEGWLTSPEPKLEANLMNGGFDYQPLGLRVHKVGLEATATKHLVSLKSFRAHPIPLQRNLKSGLLDIIEEGPSPIRARGSVRLDDWQPGTVQARLDLDNALLSSRKEQILRISGGVDLSKQWPEVAVDGQLRVNQGYLVRDAASFYATAPLELDPNLIVVRGTEPPRRAAIAEGPDEPPLYESFDVNVQFDMNRNFEADILMPFVDDLGALGASISSADVKVRLDGRGQIAIRGGELGLHGEVEVVSGRARVLQSNFDLTQGTIAFVGDDYTNPILDLEGAMAVSGGQVDLHVGGTPAAPKIDFSSKAYPDQQQIFTILLTGRSPDDLSQDQGLATAQALGGLLLQSVLGGASLGGLSVEPDGTVSVGVPVAPSVFVRSTFAPQPEIDENGVSVVAEWSVARQLVLVTAWGDQESWSSVFWELRF